MTPGTRRGFLKGVLGTPALLRAQQRRPNILFCIADDQSYPHTSVYGTNWLSTPAFDRVAKEGVLFHNTFVSAPSCCPSRGTILTGQDFWRLKDASMNHTVWPGGLPVYPDLLAEAGYHVGLTGKGWGPGNWKVSERKSNPAGSEYNAARLKPPGEFVSPIDYSSNFEAFLNKKPVGSPFCFWAGFQEPHRQYQDGIGVKHGKRLADVRVPAFLPDSEQVRSDLADYAFEVEWHDQHLGRMLKLLEARGELDNTIVVVTADNGMPFPRAKASLYDYGARMPLAIRWGARVKPGRTVEDFVSFVDFAPTFLAAAGVSAPSEMTGRSLLPLLESSASGQINPARDHVVMGIERHFPGGRPGGAGYPSRAIRTKEFLYISNLNPNAEPVGGRPAPAWPANDPTQGYSDVDGGPAKTYLVQNRAKYPRLFDLAFSRRPAEELYEVSADPFQLKNLATTSGRERSLKLLREKLAGDQRRTRDPRIAGPPEYFEGLWKKYPTQAAAQ
jgi:uncharacterized sulfatase